MFELMEKYFTTVLLRNLLGLLIVFGCFQNIWAQSQIGRTGTQIFKYRNDSALVNGSFYVALKAIDKSGNFKSFNVGQTVDFSGVDKKSPSYSLLT